MRILTKAQVLMLHEQLVNETGGSLGLRDEGMLESALASPFQEFATFSPYPTIQQKAARLGTIHLLTAINVSGLTPC